jgi:hypothetical protein
MGLINNLSSNYLQSILGNLSSGSASNPAANTASGLDTSSIALQPDNQQLSPFAQILSQLQQLQQTDPAKYQQVTGQIATNLESAAQTAQADGNSTLAAQLNKLATDFTNASQSGQLPNIQDLAQAASGHHHHHHHHAESASGDADGDSSAASSASQALTQLLSGLQSGTQDASTDPLKIILNTLDAAGTRGSNS